MKYYFTDKRALTYLIWAVLVGGGFYLTYLGTLHDQRINLVWAILSAIGLGFMFAVMPFSDKRMLKIFISWLIVIAIGMVISVLSFNISELQKTHEYLGAFWLMLMGAGYILNGIFDPPSKWYWIVAIVNILGGIAVYLASFNQYQYMAAAIISVWSLLMLWLYRSRYE